MSEKMDAQLIRTARANDDLTTRGLDPAFCLATVWNAEPGSPAAEHAKEELLKSVAPANDHSSYVCPVEDCTNRAYPKNPDYQTDEDTVRPEGVFNPVTNEHCGLSKFCLKEAFEIGTDMNESGLKESVRAAAGLHVGEVSGKVAGSRFTGGNYCVAPGCTMMVGFSEDGVGGTRGECIAEVTLEVDQHTPKE